MEIWTLSDLHLKISQARAFEIPFAVPEADVCVVAGDVTDGIVPGLEWLARCVRPHMPVVAVLGNHDFFGHDIPEARRTARRLAAECGIHLLDDSSADIDGVRFVGGTLWTDFRLLEEREHGAVSQRECMSVAKSRFADFDEIWATEAKNMQMARLFSPRDAVKLHESTLSFLDRCLIERDPATPTVVVTHHAPSPLSIHERYASDPTSAAYASDLTSLVNAYQPDIWIHGHVHDSFDYQIGRTRVLCNPRGYEARANPDFLPSLLCSIEAARHPQANAGGRG